MERRAQITWQCTLHVFVEREARLIFNVDDTIGTVIEIDTTNITLMSPGNFQEALHRQGMLYEY